MREGLVSFERVPDWEALEYPDPGSVTDPGSP